ncbi:MAG: hypothetical protein NZ838_08030 [Candidatus Marinimicrobia bacterium]|nr:hypothetical protein [Candidatus Neomarinimicrobiota bacterium]
MKRIFQIPLPLIFLFFTPSNLHACATCFGDPSAPAMQGMNWAIITLLGVTGGVLGGVIHTIMTIRKKTKKFNQLNKR